MKKVKYIICIIFLFSIILAGIYRFNFTDDDIYIKNVEGKIVPIHEIKRIKNDNN